MRVALSNRFFNQTKKMKGRSAPHGFAPEPNTPLVATSSIQPYRDHMEEGGGDAVAVGSRTVGVKWGGRLRPKATVFSFKTQNLNFRNENLCCLDGFRLIFYLNFKFQKLMNEKL
jgi:hypothetical protein